MLPNLRHPVSIYLLHQFLYQYFQVLRIIGSRAGVSGGSMEPLDFRESLNGTTRFLRFGATEPVNFEVCLCWNHYKYSHCAGSGLSIQNPAPVLSKPLRGPCRVVILTSQFLTHSETHRSIKSGKVGHLIF